MMNSGRGGIDYEDIRVGEGPLADRGCVVEIRYDLFLNRGDEIQANQNSTFRLGERTVIAGLEYGVEGMRQGGERRVRVGSHLAYRDKGVIGLIPPNALLEFHITLLRVERKRTDADE
jgi:FKBP-type peptidyl-prolyl cis-trans isomerase